MQSFVPADELIGEGKSMHEATLLQPEDTAEAAPKHTTGQQLNTQSDALTASANDMQKPSGM